MRSEEMDDEAIREADIRANAREWFSERISLLVWLWDDDVPGGCEPSRVVSSHESGRLLPAAVKREEPGFLKNLLESEWRCAGKGVPVLPEISSLPDRQGRMVWKIGFGGMSPEARALVGRALIRPPVMGSWDLVKGESVYIDSAKVCYMNMGGVSVFDPSVETVVEWFEELDLELDAESNFVLMFRKAGTFHVWITSEGCIVEVSVDHHPSGTFRAAWPGPGKGVRDVPYSGLCADEEFLAPSAALEILVRFFAKPEDLPQVPGLIWRRQEPDLGWLGEEGFA